MENRKPTPNRPDDPIGIASNPTGERGGPLYRGMDRTALDSAYDNVAHVGQAKRDAIVSGWANRSAVMRKSPRARLDLRYGQGPRHRLDALPCRTPGAPTLV